MVTVTPASSGVYTVTGNNGGCVGTKTLQLFVVNVPTITASGSPTMICSGATSTLTAGGAISYTWNPGSLLGNIAAVTPTSSTVYTVTGANGAGCTSTKTVNIVVNTPTITTAGTASICIGNSGTLTANGASSYTWTPGTLTGTSVVVSPTVTTTYTVVGTNTMGCTGSTTVSLVVNTIPTVTAVSSNTSICAGSSATLTGNGATSYTWNPGALTGTSVVVSPTTTTTYSVVGASGACSSVTETLNLVVIPGPTVTAASSPTALCSGSSATLTAGGALSYTWNPGVLTGTSIVVSPTVTTDYTVTGENASGCTSTTTISVLVNTPTLTATATPTSICVVGSVTLNVSGASTYTWNPGAATGSSVVVNPTVTTTYTVDGINSFGCTGSNTVMVTVYNNPTVTVASTPTTICSGYSGTLTASGATTYTWMPGSLTGSNVVVSPTVTTTYTVTGENGSCIPDTKTITLNVLPSPANVVATNSGTITCLSPSVNLTGSSTSTNVTYSWSGPNSYTSALQNPTGITSGGIYTLSVTDAANGCVTTATTSVETNTAGPAVTLASTGTITCLSNTVSVSVSSTVAAVSYTWSGPASFTSTAASFTTSTAGIYTLSAFDPASGCTSTNTIATITDTYVAVTATILPATCTGSVSNNNGTIILGNFISTDKFDYVTGSTYTGTATYASAPFIPAGGQITNTLPNPTVNTAYTVRIFGVNGCFKDTTLTLIPVDCATNNALGIAKAVTTTSLMPDGSYDVDYKIVVKNTGFAALTNVSLVENLSATFPLPTTFSVVSAPMITTTGSSLTLDPAFDGSTQTNLTNTVTSQLPVGQVDTIVFKVNVKPNGVFGTFKNTVLGEAMGGSVKDSSHVGLDSDPDADGDPTNNNTPTPLDLTPNLFFGLTKSGSVSDKLQDNTYDITYTITVHNLGNDTLRNVVVKDSITLKSPASFTMKSGPSAAGNLFANSSYNGSSDINLLVPASSKIAPGTTHEIVFTINVNPDTVKIITNSAFGNAINSTSISVSDTTNNGNNPDLNGNGVWNEASDNIPTVLTLPDDEMVIPEGFSPNGDGKNDLFVVKGYDTIEKTLTVYNRWGNKVYVKDNYDNSWDGTPNVGGTLGKQKLPQGTYYYILEFKNSEFKTVTGFVVLQY